MWLSANFTLRWRKAAVYLTLTSSVPGHCSLLKMSPFIYQFIFFMVLSVCTYTVYLTIWSIWGWTFNSKDALHARTRTFARAEARCERVTWGSRTPNTNCMVHSEDAYQCAHSRSVYVPCSAAVVAGDRRILQEVQPHVVVELLRRARVEGLRQVLHLRHEVIHVLLHGGEIQREALRGVSPVRTVRGRRRLRRCASRLRVSAASEPPCVKSPGVDQHQQQHRGNHPHRCHPVPAIGDRPPNAKSCKGAKEFVE